MSKLEEAFSREWSRLFPEIELLQEVAGIQGRRFRFDFAHLNSKVAVEIQGGIYVGGRHSGGVGQRKDFEKINLAILNGWVVFQLSGDMVQTEWLEIICEVIRERQS
jgi:very-short-patch-repair endonuclease